MLLVAVGEGRTLSGVEEVQLQDHVAGCEKCRALTVEPPDERLRWVARIPEDALDDPDLLVLPTVDPIVFAKGDELAHGGMGRITRARDRRLGRDVAIKEVLAPYLRARFEREAMITARLQHPAIVPVYEAGTWPDGSAFYTMRLVSGGTLADAIARTQTLEDRLALLPHVLALTEALAYAHSRRVVHRDLKPANVLVGEFGETVVIDWGLAKELAREVGPAGPEADAGAGAPVASDLTRAGSVVGTPCFIAPEQAAGAEIDERADVYALGAILYNLLAGHPPHWDSTEHSADRLIDAARQTPPTPIDQLVPRVPADLRAIVERAMARDKAARYPTAREMAEELRRFEAGQLLGSREYTTRELIVRWIRRHRAAVAVAAVAAGVLAIGGVVSVRQILARQRETERALAESQLEQGRQLLVGGDPAQAAPYLAAALAELPDDPVAQRLAATALRDAPRRLGSFVGTAAVFRRDGGELAVGRADGSIAVIDPATAATVRTLAAAGGAIAQLDYAPDGARLAAGTATGAYLRDAATGALLAMLSSAPVSELRFLPSGDRVVVVSAGMVSLVGLDGKVVAADDRVADPHTLALSGDGAIVVAVTHDGAVAWRATDLSRVAEVTGETEIRFAALLDRGEAITAGLDGVRRWGPVEHRAKLMSDVVVSLTRLDGHTVMADGTILGLDTGAARLLAPGAVKATAVIDPTHVVTGGYDHTMRIWDLERAARPIVIVDTATATQTLVVDPTGRRAFTHGWNKEAGVELWDVAHVRAPVRTAVAGTQIDTIYSDHRDRLAIHVRDAGTEATRLLTSGFEVVAALDGWPLGFRPNSDEIVTHAGDHLGVYSTRNGRHVRDVVDPDRIGRITFSPTGAVIATSSGRHITLRDASWQVTRRFDVSPDAWTIAVDDHGRVITGHDDGALRIWDARTGGLLATATGHSTYVTSIEVRGDAVVTGSWDGTLRLWALPSGEPRGIVKTFDKLASDVAISPGGRLIASGDGLAELNLWDGAQGRLIDQIPISDTHTCVAFIDDDHIVVGGEGGRLELVDISVAPRTADEVTHLVDAAPRWHLVRGRAVERTPSEALR